jgi:hypothetical protein
MVGKKAKDQFELKVAILYFLPLKSSLSLAVAIIWYDFYFLKAASKHIKGKRIIMITKIGL